MCIHSGSVLGKGPGEREWGVGAGASEGGEDGVRMCGLVAFHHFTGWSSGLVRNFGTCYSEVAALGTKEERSTCLLVSIFH